MNLGSCHEPVSKMERKGFERCSSIHTCSFTSESSLHSRAELRRRFVCVPRWSWIKQTATGNGRENPEVIRKTPEFLDVSTRLTKKDTNNQKPTINQPPPPNPHHFSEKLTKSKPMEL